MARGWESKSVEDQIDMAEVFRATSAVKQLNAEALDASRTRESLLMSRTRVVRELENAQKAYRAARNRLEESPQAVIPRARRLAELGVKGKKKLPADLEPEDLEDEALSRHPSA